MRSAGDMTLQLLTLFPTLNNQTRTLRTSKCHICKNVWEKTETNEFVLLPNIISKQYITQLLEYSQPDTNLQTCPHCNIQTVTTSTTFIDFGNIILIRTKENNSLPPQLISHPPTMTTYKLTCSLNHTKTPAHWSCTIFTDKQQQHVNCMPKIKHDNPALQTWLIYCKINKYTAPTQANINLNQYFTKPHIDTETLQQALMALTEPEEQKETKTECIDLVSDSETIIPPAELQNNTHPLNINQYKPTTADVDSTQNDHNPAPKKYTNHPSPAAQQPHTPMPAVNFSLSQHHTPNNEPNDTYSPIQNDTVHIMNNPNYEYIPPNLTNVPNNCWANAATQIMLYLQYTMPTIQLPSPLQSIPLSPIPYNAQPHYERKSKTSYRTIIHKTCVTRYFLSLKLLITTKYP